MKRTIKIFLYAAFVFYCAVVLGYIFFVGRITFEDDSIGRYFQLSNYIPFKTFYDYIQRLQSNSINLQIVIYNIIGNLFFLFPLGCFLPCLFRFFQKFSHTFFITLGIVCVLEILQPLFRIGFFDIDDIILNMTGACLGFFFVHIPFVNKILEKIYIYA